MPPKKGNKKKGKRKADKIQKTVARMSASAPNLDQRPVLQDASTSAISAAELDNMRSCLEMCRSEASARAGAKRAPMMLDIETVDTMSAAMNDPVFVADWTSSFPKADVNQDLGDGEGGRTLLQRAAYRGHYRVVWALLQCGATLQTPPGYPGEDQGYGIVSEELRLCCNSSVWGEPASKMLEGKSPEILDVIPEQPPRNFAKVARLLIEAGASPNAPYIKLYGEFKCVLTPLSCACDRPVYPHEAFNLVKYLLSAGSDPNEGLESIFPPEYEYDFPLENAIDCEDDELAEFLVVSAGARTRKALGGRGILDPAACKGLNKTVHAIVTGRSWRTDTDDEFEHCEHEQVALLSACWHGHADVVATLLAFGDRDHLDITNPWDSPSSAPVGVFVTPLQAAATNGHAKVIDRLLISAYHHDERAEEAESILPLLAKGCHAAALLQVHDYGVSLGKIQEAVNEHCKGNVKMQQLLGLLADPTATIPASSMASKPMNDDASSSSGDESEANANHDWHAKLFPVAEEVLARWRVGYEQALVVAVPLKEQGTAFYKESRQSLGDKARAGSLKQALQCYTKALFQFEGVGAEQLLALVCGTHRKLGAQSAVRLLHGSRSILLKSHVAPFLCDMQAGQLKMQRCAAECASNASLMLLKLGCPEAAFERGQVSLAMDVTFLKALERMKLAAEAVKRNTTCKLGASFYRQQAVATEQAAQQAAAMLTTFRGWIPPVTTPALVATQLTYARLEQERTEREMRETFDVHMGSSPGVRQVQLVASLVPFSPPWSTRGQWLTVCLRWDAEAAVGRSAQECCRTFDAGIQRQQLLYLHFCEADDEGGDVVQLPPHGRATPYAYEFCRRRLLEVVKWFTEKHYNASRTIWPNPGWKNSDVSPVIPGNACQLVLGQGLMGLADDDVFNGGLDALQQPGEERVHVAKSSSTHASIKMKPGFAYETHENTRAGMEAQKKAGLG
jgi:ankyrin repeat protein